MGDCYKLALQKLKDGKKVLFSGTPCQVGGLKTYLIKDYANLLCVDFVCHGVPSPMAWKKYIYYPLTLFRNVFINKIPSRHFRRFIDKLMGARYGKNSFLALFILLLDVSA